MWDIVMLANGLTSCCLDPLLYILYQEVVIIFNCVHDSQAYNSPMDLPVDVFIWLSLQHFFFLFG